MARPSVRLAPNLRFLWNQPGFAALATLTLALGIGVNVALFSALEAVVLNPLPFPQADRLVAVYEDAAWLGYKKNTPAPANFSDWKRESKSFEGMAATRGCRPVLTGDGPPEDAAKYRIARGRLLLRERTDAPPPPPEDEKKPGASSFSMPRGTEKPNSIVNCQSITR